MGDQCLTMPQGNIYMIVLQKVGELSQRAIVTILTIKPDVKVTRTMNKRKDDKNEN
jgi:hypothetical protein